MGAIGPAMIYLTGCSIGLRSSMRCPGSGAHNIMAPLPNRDYELAALSGY